MRALTVDDVLALRQIEELVLRRGRAADAKDPDAILAQHVPGSKDTHGIFDGTIEDFVEHLRIQNYQDRQYGPQRHTVSNIVTDLISVDVARVESMHLAYHRLKLAEGVYDVFIGGRYLDKCKRADGGWLISNRMVVYDWSRSSPATGPSMGTDSTTTTTSTKETV